jgi:spore germination protein
MFILKNPLYIFVIVLFVLLALFIYKAPRAAIISKTIPMTIKNSQPATHLKVLGWIPFWDQEKASASFLANADKFNFISVFWYELDKNGRIQPYDASKIDKTLIAKAHAKNVKVLALIANLSEGDNWDSQRVNKVISSEKARSQHIQKLVALTEENNFDGIDIDYEALRSYQKDDFSLFIDELAYALHKKGKVLGVAIHPKTAEDKPEEDNGSHAQDLARISDAADQLYFMTYLENGISSQPGPLATPDWIVSIINYALGPGKVDPRKAYLGIGLTGAEWKKNMHDGYKGSRDDITFDEIYAHVQKAGLHVKWQDESPYVEDKTGVIWFENSISTAERLKLAQALGVRGVAFWRLGGEDGAMWQWFNK